MRAGRHLGGGIPTAWDPPITVITLPLLGILGALRQQLDIKRSHRSGYVMCSSHDYMLRKSKGIQGKALE